MLARDLHGALRTYARQALREPESADGAWEEHFYSGTGFPRVFYLKYDLYRRYFPLTALARFRRLMAKA